MSKRSEKRKAYQETVRRTSQALAERASDVQELSKPLGIRTSRYITRQPNDPKDYVK